MNKKGNQTQQPTNQATNQLTASGSNTASTVNLLSSCVCISWCEH